MNTVDEKKACVDANDFFIMVTIAHCEVIGLTIKDDYASLRNINSTNVRSNRENNGKFLCQFIHEIEK